MRAKPLITGVFALVGAIIIPAPGLRAHDPGPSARSLQLRALLDESQVVRTPEFQPPSRGTGSAASGVANLTIDDVEGHFTLDLRIDGIDPVDLDATHGPNLTAVHIRGGSPSERGDILIDVQHFARDLLPGTDGVIQTAGGFELLAQANFGRNQGALDTDLELPELIEALRTGEAYIAIHTTTSALFREGEIRGQLELVPDKLRFSASLDAAQVPRPVDQRPPSHGTGSDATGEASFELNTKSGWFRLDLDVRGIDPDDLEDAHGANGTAIHIRTGGADELGDILADVHHFAREALFDTNGVMRTGDGFTLRVEGRFARRQGALDTGVLLADAVDALRLGRGSITVHTSTSPLFANGEIRGGLLRARNTITLAPRLDGEQVVRPKAFRPPRLGSGSAAIGSATLEVDRDDGSFEVVMDVAGIDSADLDDSHGANRTAIHVHWGTPGQSGPILIDLGHFARGDPSGSNGLTPTADGFELRARGFVTTIQGEHDTQWTLQQALSFLHTGQAYVDIHTATEPIFESGEIRGDMAAPPLEPVRLAATLDGRQVVRPPELQPPTHGTGSASMGECELTVDPREGRFTFSLSVEGIFEDDLDLSNGANGTAVHIHRGDPVTRDSILLDVHQFARWTSGFTATDEGFTIETSGRITQSQGQLDTGFASFEIIAAMLEGDAFVTIHTVKNQLYRFGEIRGNLRPERPSSPRFLRGDCNGDGAVGGNVVDAITLLDLNFRGGGLPACLAACDANGDGQVLGVVTDAVYLLTYGFLGGAPPLAPFPDCGESSETSDLELGCESPCD